jgi:hypothetical protein
MDNPWLILKTILSNPLIHSFSCFPTMFPNPSRNPSNYPLVICYMTIENGPVEIADLPMNSMVDLSSSLC